MEEETKPNEYPFEELRSLDGKEIIKGPFAGTGECVEIDEARRDTKPNEYPCTLGGCVEPAPNGMTEEEWRLKNIEYAESLTYLSSAGLKQYKDLIDIMYEERTGKKLERETKTHEIEPVVEDIRVNEDRIVEKLIARMEEKGFAKVHDPDYIAKAIDSLYPPGFIGSPEEPESCPKGFVEFETGGKHIYGELRSLDGKTSIRGPFRGNGEWIEVDAKTHEEFIRKAKELISNAPPSESRLSLKTFKLERDEPLDDATIDSIKKPLTEEEFKNKLQFGCREPTPDYIKDMYKLPSEPMNPLAQHPIDTKDYKYGGMGKMHRITPEQKATCAREAQIKEEFEKSDWQFFKQFVRREWSAAKELWNRWRGR
jgi:hypothetical protein